MDMGLTDKRVIVTGASRGIGAAIAHRFLLESARVQLVSRGSEQLYLTEDELQTRFSIDSVKAYKCDCTDAAAIEELKNSVIANWRGVDVVVANVGDGRSSSEPLPDNAQWQSTWETNFESALLTARAFTPLLQQSKGCLLFISSIAGLEAIGAPVDYSTAKSALIALAKNMSRKLAPDVRINVIAPGNILFPGGSWDEKIQLDEQRVNRIIKSSVPMNRFGQADEIADSAVFLCSDRASFITGAVLAVDGGQTVGVS